MLLTLIAKTFQGLEPVLAKELENLGAEDIKILNRAVSFEAPLEFLYKANLYLRTALRIIHPLADEKVHNQKELYEVARSVNWTRWFTPRHTFSIKSTVSNAPSFNNSTFVSMKVKDAIVDQFRDFKGSRPSVDRENPDVRIEVRIFKNLCTISIDSSGDSLHRRGYRTGGHRAPINEVLAAGMVLMTGWDGTNTFLDPMCGSGTIITEAAMYAANIAPNLKRKTFGLHHWKNFDEKLWDKVWLEARVGTRDFEGSVMGSDISKNAINEARDNVVEAGVDEWVRLGISSFADRKVPKQTGTILFNPPYDERLHIRDIEQFYKEIGDTLKQNYSGFEAWLLSNNQRGVKRIGLRPSQRIVLYNGALECRLLKYELYKGRKEEENKEVVKIKEETVKLKQAKPEPSMSEEKAKTIADRDLEIAKEMKANGIDLALIEKITGLTKDVIENL